MKVSMGLSAILIATIGVVLAQEGPKHREHMDQCMKEFPVDESVFKKMHSGEEVADDENLKCFIKCIMEKSGHIDKDGVVQVKQDEDGEHPPKFAKFQEHLEKCKDIKADTCDGAFKLKLCILEQMKKDKM